MNFEWDDNKEIINIAKHGISFIDAVKVFDDEFAIEEYDLLHSNFYEERYKIIGYVTDFGLITLVYSVISEDLFRIISARHTTNTERKIYEKKNIYRRS